MSVLSDSSQYCQAMSEMMWGQTWARPTNGNKNCTKTGSQYDFGAIALPGSHLKMKIRIPTILLQEIERPREVNHVGSYLSSRNGQFESVPVKMKPSPEVFCNGLLKSELTTKVETAIEKFSGSLHKSCIKSAELSLVVADCVNACPSTLPGRKTLQSSSENRELRRYLRTVLSGLNRDVQDTIEAEHCTDTPESSQDISSHDELRVSVGSERLVVPCVSMDTIAGVQMATGLQKSEDACAGPRTETIHIPTISDNTDIPTADQRAISIEGKGHTLCRSDNVMLAPQMDALPSEPHKPQIRSTISCEESFFSSPSEVISEQVRCENVEFVRANLDLVGPVQTQEADKRSVGRRIEGSKCAGSVLVRSARITAQTQPHVPERNSIEHIERESKSDVSNLQSNKRSVTLNPWLKERGLTENRRRPSTVLNAESRAIKGPALSIQPDRSLKAQLPLLKKCKALLAR
jgi:hypothetical protein